MRLCCVPLTTGNTLYDLYARKIYLNIIFDFYRLLGWPRVGPFVRNTAIDEYVRFRKLRSRPANGDSQEHIESPNIHPDNTCGAGWICEHRCRQIYNMVRFRNTVARTNVTDCWDNGSKQIAFCREDAGFVAFNGDDKDTKVTINGCLLPGRYCDLTSGDLESGRCTGKIITVRQNNTVYVETFTSDEDGVIAIDKNVSYSYTKHLYKDTRNIVNVQLLLTSQDV